MRYQTAAAGESWSVHGRFFSGRTVTCALFNGETGAAIAQDSTTAAEIGSTGIYHYDSDQVTTDPTSLTSIVWQMTDSLSGVTDEGIIVVGGYVDSISGLVTDVAALNDLSSADVQSAMTAQGYTTARAALIDNLDAAVSTIASAIAALNDLSSADVQSAMTVQGYTTVRAALLDNLDAAVSVIASAIVALNDLSSADVQSALTAQGYTSARAALIDNLDAAISSLNDLSSGDVQSALTAQGYTSALATSLAALYEYVEGGREIDFTGNDALGWQRVERDTSGSEVARYNLFDEAGARITSTVSAFLSAAKMISKEVKL